MKPSLFVAIFFFLCSLSAQDSISTSDWQEDLRFLQHTVNQKYSFLFKKLSKTEFNDTVDAFHAAIPNMGPHEIVVGFSKIIALFKYGHTRMSYSDAPVPFHSIPVEFYRFKDGLRIKSAQKKYEAIIGAKVIAIEEVSINDVIKAVYPTVPVENAMFFNAYGLDNMSIPEVLHAQGITSELKRNLNLTLEKDGKRFDKVFEATPNLWPPMHYGEVKPDSDWINGRDKSTTPNYLKNFGKVYYYEYFEDSKTVYVRHSRIQSDETENVEDFYNRVFEFIDANKVEKFVLDVRLNGGGNSFLNKPIITGIIANQKINKPGRFFVITGRRTFSAAQRLINELDNYTNVLFVGEPSSENINFYGDNKRVVLPKSSLPVYLSFVWWQDKAQWQNADYIKPDYPVEMTYNDYVTNQDPALDTVLNFNASKFTLEPISYLTKLFKDGKAKEANYEAKRMALDWAYSFIDFERELTNSAFVSLGNDNEKALFLFEVCTFVFPESQSVWNNFGQALLETGDIKGAKKAFESVLAISKEGSFAIKAEKRLSEIKGRR